MFFLTIFFKANYVNMILWVKHAKEENIFLKIDDIAQAQNKKK